ncbi:aromatic acid exporter family protein [uncultured Ornithinimicrobium sp.]|uniref:FUSC family protein n=1 Tax=uncultured Ornithinimicrobium sp. TaxID=259307 RepID=UPI0025999031|nr:hypothetical protein [uncultured Ornithinimicrobium sp.]
MATPTPRQALLRSVSLWDRNPIAANAFRTMLAVALAWIVASNLPGEASNYAYYAPLGAVIATTNNPGGSLRTALQASAAIVLGGTAAIVADFFGDHDGWLAMGITVGIAVVLGSFRWLGPMGSWVPTAALFTLIFGGGDLPFVGYYTLLILLGAVMAILIAVVLPGQPVALAEQNLDRLRYALSNRVEDVIDRLEDDLAALLQDEQDEEEQTDSADAEGRGDQRETRGAATTGGTETEGTRQEDARSAEEMAQDAKDPGKGRAPDLDQELARARQSVAELRDARRKNQRAYQHGATIARAEDQLRAWEFAAAALGMVAASTDLRGPDRAERVAQVTCEALRALQELLDVWRLPVDTLDLRRMRAATEALDEVVNDPSTPASPTATAVLITMSRTLEMLASREKSYEDEEQRREEEKARKEQEKEHRKQEKEERKNKKETSGGGEDDGVPATTDRKDSSGGT